jgi:hypothetical protein
MKGIDIMSARDFQTKSNKTYERAWAKELNVFLKRITDRQTELNKRQAEYDKKVQECLHFLELEHPNAAKRAQVVSYLVQISQNRRMVKEELADIHSVISKFKNTSPIQETASRGYEYSQEFLVAILGEDGE